MVVTFVVMYFPHLYLSLLFKALASPSDNKKAEYKDDEISADVKYPVKHVLSRELQVPSYIHVDCVLTMSFIPLLIHYDC